MLDEAGYTSVVATNCEQAYHRYLRLGEQLTVTHAAWRTSPAPSAPALGEGWFVTTRSTWYAGDEAVASMVFRVLKFRPPAARPPTAEPAPAAADVLHPLVSPDTEFFWAGTAAGELRIQRCGGVRRAAPPARADVPGLRRGQAAGTRSPPAPARCTATWCTTTRRCPGKQLPIVVALVELTEGVRMVGELLGVRPDQVRDRPAGPGRRSSRVDDELTLPAWRDRTSGDGPRRRPSSRSCDRRDADVRDRLGASRPATSRTCTTTGTAPSPGAPRTSSSTS